MFRIFKRRLPALPAPIAVTFTEGGEWHAFPVDRAKIYRKNSFGAQTRGITVHSIMFEDGMRWDAVNGWNDDRYAAGLHGITVAQYRKDRLRDCLKNIR
jgi:hypothetical protein